MPKPAFDSPEYQHALATCVRWDPEREEPYLQLPSFPDLRLTPFRAGIEDEYVSGEEEGRSERDPELGSWARLC